MAGIPWAAAAVMAAAVVEAVAGVEAEVAAAGCVVVVATTTCDRWTAAPIRVEWTRAAQAALPATTLANRMIRILRARSAKRAKAVVRAVKRKAAAGTNRKKCP